MNSPLLTRLFSVLLLPAFLLAPLPAAAESVLWNGSGSGGVLVPGGGLAEDPAVTLWGSWFDQGGLLQPGDAASRVRYGFGAVWSPLRMDTDRPYGIEIGGRMGGASVTNSLGSPATLDSFGDLGLHLKGSYRVSDTWLTGIRLGALLYSGVEGESGFGDTASYAAEWVSTWRPGRFALHTDVGYLYDRTVNFTTGAPTEFERFAWGQNDYTQLVYGLGLQYDQRVVSYHLELSGELPLGAAAPGFSESPLRVTPGLRVRPWGSLEVLLAANVPLTDTGAGIPVQPDYDVLASLGWTFGQAAAAASDDDAPPRVDAPAAPAPAVSDPAAAGVLTGRVVHAVTGDPLAEATVTVLPDGPTLKTTSEGSFLFPGLAEGTARLQVEALGMTPETLEAQVRAGAMSSVEVRLAPLPTDGTVEIEVVDPDGRPVAGARVTLDGAAAGETDAQGKVRIEKVGVGRHEIEVREEGFESAQRSVSVAAGKTAAERMALVRKAKPGFVDVKVMNENREALDARLTIEGRPELERTVKAAGGGSTLYKLDPGSYRVRAEAAGYAPQVQEIVVEEDGEHALRFRLAR